MTKTSGYHITLKAFIPSSRTDFTAQARAATTMAELMAGKVITPGFVELAKIVSVDGRYGSMEVAEELADIDPADMAGGESDPPAEQETAPTPRQKRSSSQG